MSTLYPMFFSSNSFPVVEHKQEEAQHIAPVNYSSISPLFFQDHVASLVHPSSLSNCQIDLSSQFPCRSKQSCKVCFVIEFDIKRPFPVNSQGTSDKTLKSMDNSTYLSSYFVTNRVSSNEQHSQDKVILRFLPNNEFTKSIMNQQHMNPVFEVFIFLLLHSSLLSHQIERWAQFFIIYLKNGIASVTSLMSYP